MKNNRPTIPYVGYHRHLDAYVVSLELDLRAIVDVEFRLADEALARIRTAKYPLIIVNDILAPGKLEIPYEPNRPSETRTALHVIRQIKKDESNKNTPIIATLIPVSGYTEPEWYTCAGADSVFDLSTGNVEAFISIAKRYLQR
jgi:CheY-like chemotaxis protein